MRKTKRRSFAKQQMYKMKGCSRTRKTRLFSSKGGGSLSIPATVPVNTNAANPVYPNTGAVSHGTNTIFNNASPQTGGSCPLCAQAGGSAHRTGCRCSQCKQQKGGSAYPNGLVGTSWTSNTHQWPGVNGVPGDSNHYPLNTYATDISRQMTTNPPLIGGKKGRGRGRGRGLKGGSLSNFMGQDLINLGRQFQFGVGSAYNALAGYNAPINPLPWKDQMHVKPAFNPATI